MTVKTINLSLRNRLLVSYLILLVGTLGVAAVALFVLLGGRPVPPQATYERLAVYAESLNVRNLLEEFGQGAGDDLVAKFAQSRNVRVLHVLVSTSDSQQVLFDSAGTFKGGDSIQLEQDDFFVARLAQELPARYDQIFGAFSDEDGSAWLFGGFVTPRLVRGTDAWVLATPRPTQSLQQTLVDFGVSLGMPLLEAGLVGVIVAIVLAFFISRSIARPLQALVLAATAVAEGHFDQHVPVTGPPEMLSVADAFNRMSAEVLASQNAQRDFMANVSHDLKTPLTSIQGYSQAIMDGAAKDPAQAASIIYEEAGRMNRMVVELTDLARIQAGRLSMQTTAIDMGEITAAIGQRLSVVAHKKGVTLDVEAEPMPVIAGDGDRLAQVLANLISNAIKYTPTGGCVWVKTRVNNGGVEVIVQDTGIGIPPQDIPRVFERFYQVDKARGPKRGTGLGLAITAEIVQAHGGRITAASAGEGKGSTFTVWLPSPQLTTVVRGRR